MSVAVQELVIKAPDLRGASLALGSCRDIEVCLDGPAGTGKTYGALYKIHMMLLRYAGAKALIARKTNTALTSTALATYRELVHVAENIHYFGGNKVRPAAFEYPNGSLLIISGLDKPEKIKSLEIDLCFVNEATEITLEDLEFVRSRLRHGKLPYHQIILDANPGHPSHWLNVRMKKGLTTRLKSYHEDNPRFFDNLTQDWTEEGRAYIFGVLEGLTGVRYLRMRQGVWAASEGVVFELWNPDIHRVTRQQLIDWNVFYTNGRLNRQVIKHIVAGVDWGWTNPGTINVFGVDSDGRMYLLRQIYRTQRTIDWWIEQGQVLMDEFQIERFECDPSQPGYIAQFNGAGLPASPAINDIALGIGFLRKRLEVAGDGRPRFFVYEYALLERDYALEAAHKPVCFEDEIEAYIWAEPKDGKPLKEVPVDDNNHSIDPTRYVAASLDAGNAMDSLDSETIEALNNFIGY